MTEVIQLGDTTISVTRKAVKHVHLSVHPPRGRVTLVAPVATRLDVARAYAVSKLRWIRQRQLEFRAQAREAPHRLVDRESLQLWGRRHLLTTVYAESKPSVSVDHRRIVMSVRPGTTPEKRQEIIKAWHISLLHEVVPPLIQKWEPRLGVRVSAYFLQRMKTKWGSCNQRAGHIRLNTQLVTKPKDLVEYVVVHEMLHLTEPRHSDRFLALLSKHFPGWREAREELNALPLAAENWEL